MRYTYLQHELPSPSDTGLITKSEKTRPAPLILQEQQQQQKVQARLPTSQRHRIRKASISTGGSSFPSVERQPSAAKKLKAMPEKDGVVVEVESPREMRAASKIGLHKTAASPRLKAWESYLHWLCLTEEPGTLWASSLCATFHECLAPNAACTYPATAAECAARIDDIYWSFYLPLDPLLQFMEDRILSGYLLHVWTMFVELGKRISHDDPAQDKLVELLKELVHLPPMEVRTWEVSLLFMLMSCMIGRIFMAKFSCRVIMLLGLTCPPSTMPLSQDGMISVCSRPIKLNHARRIN